MTAALDLRASLKRRSELAQLNEELAAARLAHAHIHSKKRDGLLCGCLTLVFFDCHLAVQKRKLNAAWREEIATRIEHM